MKLSSVPREFILAAACAAWPRSEHRADTIRRGAAEVGDWGRFYRVVLRHRIAGLAYDGMTAARIALPSDVVAALRAEAGALARQSLVMAAEATRLHRALADSDIPGAFLKGSTLAMLAYGSLGLRHGKDIDILVPQDRAAAAAKLVERLGYRRTRPHPGLDEAKIRRWPSTFKDFSYVHERSRVPLELHWRLSDNPRLIPVPPASSWTRIAIGEGIALPTLAPDDLLTYLCAHGAYHAWFRLKWIADIGALLARHRESARGLLARSEATGQGRLAVLALTLSRDLLGTAIPPDAGFEERPLSRLLARIALAAMTRGEAETEPEDMLFGSTLISLSAYLLGNWRHALTQARRDLVSEDDWQMVQLPDRLIFAYPLLRLPLWLWRLALRRPRLREQA